MHNQIELGEFKAIPGWTGNGDGEDVEGGVMIILNAGEELADKVNDAVRQLPLVTIRGTKAMNAADFAELNDNFPNLAHLDISGTATTEIPITAFHNKTSLHAIILPEGMKVIGNSAFRNSGLESIKIPASVEIFGDYAFANCISLKSATLTEGLAVIGDYAFYRSGLESVVIPASVGSFGQDAFAYCSSLKSATLKDGLEVIGESQNRSSIDIPSETYLRLRD